MLPRRSKSQRIGDHGESIVHDILDCHSHWIARTQSRDFGIDLEAELAVPVGNEQRLEGKLIKVQVKTFAHIKQNQARIAVPLDRDLLNYASQFKVPVILAAVCLQTRGVWWVWLQEWAMLHERLLAEKRGQKKITISIALEQTLRSGLDGPLQGISRGEGLNSIVINLRDLLMVAIGWENRAISDGVVKLLATVHGPSRDWTLQKIVDVLLGYGEDPPFWQAQQTLPVLLSLVDIAGDILTQDQLLRLVARGSTCSRTGLLAMARLYDQWPEHARALSLPRAFSQAGSLPAAWYAAMRERFPDETSDIFWMRIANKTDADLRYKNIELQLSPDILDYINAKWPNRGDSVLIDCLVLTTKRGSKKDKTLT